MFLFRHRCRIFVHELNSGVGCELTVAPCRHDLCLRDSIPKHPHERVAPFRTDLMFMVLVFPQSQRQVNSASPAAVRLTPSTSRRPNRCPIEACAGVTTPS